MATDAELIAAARNSLEAAWRTTHDAYKAAREYNSPAADALFEATLDANSAIVRLIKLRDTMEAR